MNACKSFGIRCQGALLVCWLCFAAVVSAEEPARFRLGDLIVSEFAGTFEDIRDQLVFSIEQKGLAVSNTAAVGDMLKRTRSDVGGARDLYGNAEIVQFCSASTAHGSTQVDAHLVGLCPYSVAVYTLSGTPGRVYVSYRTLLMPEISPDVRAALERSEALVAGVVKGISQ
ncbi:MAG: DUF302 domain-containing protein [Betaproteobacteria bacterium]|nr:DUF302 domain-containing protein [Betaproteobacteria bacterium]